MKSPLQLHPGIVVSSAIHQLSEFNGCYKLDNVFFCTIGYPFRVHVLISSHCIPSFYFSHSHHHSHTVTPLDIFSHLKNETRTLVPSLSISAWLGHTHTHSPHSPLKILIFFCICIPAQEPLYSYHFAVDWFTLALLSLLLLFIFCSGLAMICSMVISRWAVFVPRRIERQRVLL